MSARMIAKGLLSWVPGVQRAFFDPTAGGGTASGAYCYGVWIKHLTLLWEHGMREMPGAVLELGPGSTIGTGLAALLSGAGRYIGVDALAHALPQSNVAVLRELEALFARRAPRPAAGYPPIDHLLDARLFPGHILTEARLAAALAPRRLARIERAVRDPAAIRDPMIRYCTWDALDTVDPGPVDLVFSHVVINHIEDLEGTYAQCARWLRPGGWMSHHVDFTALGTAREWNGHRAYGEVAWKVIAGRRPYFVNREPLATHVALLERAGFDLVHLIRGRHEGGISRAELAPRWRGISDDDLATQTGVFLCRKR